jgi:hypothetical protein
MHSIFFFFFKDYKIFEKRQSEFNRHGVKLYSTQIILFVFEIPISKGIIIKLSPGIFIILRTSQQEQNPHYPLFLKTHSSALANSKRDENQLCASRKECNLHPLLLFLDMQLRGTTQKDQSFLF